MQIQTKTGIITEKRYQSASCSGTCKETGLSVPCFSLADNRGFSLIEVLIAIIVLSIGIFAVGKFQTSAIDGDFRADKQTQASSYAANEAERLLRLPIGHDDLKSDEEFNPHNPPSSCEQFCVGWKVTDDVPLPAITKETDGTDLTPARTQTKTIEIVVFDSGGGFDSSAKERLKIQIIKPRCL